MKLLVFLAKGFETIEFSGFIDVMGWDGRKLILAVMLRW